MQAHGKVYLITGATEGVGLHTAQSLARLDAHVIIHGRSNVRVQRLVETIRQATNNKDVYGYAADFSSLSAVRQLAAEVKQHHPQIHALINNAGVFMTEKRVSQDGLEMTWAVNVAGPFLLTSLLLDLVTERIVNVSSIMAAQHIDFDNLQQERGFSAQDAHSLSNLCTIMVTYELARRLKMAGSPVTCNCLDPGASGGNDQLVVATDPHLARVTGTYFVSKCSWPSPQVSYDQPSQQRLWRVLEGQTGAAYAV